MPTARQLTVSVPATVFDVGKSDSAGLRGAFASSPIYDGSYGTDEQVRHLFEVGVPGEFNAATGDFNDGGHAFGTVNLYYADAPNLAVVDREETGGGGKPGTAWAPNIASPGEGHGDNASAIPEGGRALTIAARGAGGAWPGDGLTSPSDTTIQIVPRPGPRRIGDSLTPGRVTRI